MLAIASYFARIKKRISQRRVSKSLISIFEIDNAEQRKYFPKQETVFTPETQNMLFIPEAKSLQANEYKTPDIFTTVLKNVLFCPLYNLVLTESRQIVKEGISTNFGGKIDLQFLKSAEVKKISGYCSIFRSAHNSYYHTIIDNLPRLFLLQEEYSKIDEIKLVCSDINRGFEQYYLQKLLPANVKVTTLDKNYLYHIDEMIFPSFLSRRFSGYLPKNYLDYFSLKVLPKRERKKDKRIYISRIKSKRGMIRCIINEELLVSQLNTLGFEPYVLENMSIEEQINLFYDAEIIIGPHGAGFTNLIFSGSIDVIELFPTKYTVPHYYYLSKSLNQRYLFWCGTEKDKEDNFNVDIKAVCDLVNTALTVK